MGPSETSAAVLGVEKTVWPRANGRDERLNKSEYRGNRPTGKQVSSCGKKCQFPKQPTLDEKKKEKTCRGGGGLEKKEKGGDSPGGGKGR